MSVKEAMATFESTRCKKNDALECKRCRHPRCTHECHTTANNGEGVEAPAAEAMPDATAPSGEVQGQTIPADAGAELTPTGEGPGSIEGATAVATPSAPGPTSADGGDSEDGHGSSVASEAPAGDFVLLPIDRIVPSIGNVRRNLGDLDELATSIQSVGIIEPLIVERCEDDDPEHDFHLVAGERRWTAAGMLGLGNVPCVVRGPIADDDERVELMLVENLQRKDLEPLEEAEGYRRLTEFGMQQRTIAERVGCSQSHVSKRLQLLDLAPKVLDAIGKEKLTVSDALELAKLEDPKRQEGALKRITSTPQCGYPPTADEAVRQEQAAAKDDAARAKITEEAKKKGWSIVAAPKSYGDKVSWRRLRKPNEYVTPGQDITLENPTAHRKEPCHGVLIESHYQGVTKTDVCTSPDRHGPKGDSELKTVVKKREPNRAEQKEREEQRRRREATKARAAVLSTAVQGKGREVGRPDVVDHIVLGFLDSANVDPCRLACELLGLEPKTSKSYGTTHKDWRALLHELAKTRDGIRQVGLALTFAVAESDLRNGWGGTKEGTERHYRFLLGLGYELAPSEKKYAKLREAAPAAADSDGIEEGAEA